jgi:hypothetical protein
MADDFTIGEGGIIIRNDFVAHEQTTEDKLFAEYEMLKRKVLRLSGSTATEEETARYKELEKRFEK